VSSVSLSHYSTASLALTVQYSTVQRSSALLFSLLHFLFQSLQLQQLIVNECDGVSE
jgi:hypothetical protein